MQCRRLENLDKGRFVEIFTRFCKAKELECSAMALDRFIEQHYVKTAHPFRRCHPRDVISHAIDLMDFENLPHHLDELHEWYSTLVGHALEQRFPCDHLPHLLVEHPELVAERIMRFADVVGRERVIASTDCGLGGRIHPQIAWAKLEALAQGAALATRALWH